MILPVTMPWLSVSNDVVPWAGVPTTCTVVGSMPSSASVSLASTLMVSGAPLKAVAVSSTATGGKSGRIVTVTVASFEVRPL